MAVLVIALGFSTSAFSISVQKKNELRNMIEQNIRVELESAQKELIQRIRNSPPESKILLAMAGIRQMFYNKAYGQYRCLVESDYFEKAEECIAISNRRIAEISTLIRDHYSHLVPRSYDCEIKSRLYEAELEFPPFDNMKGAQLFDFKLMKECLLR